MFLMIDNMYRGEFGQTHYGICDDSHLTDIVLDLIDRNCQFEYKYNMESDTLILVVWGKYLTLNQRNILWKCSDSFISRKHKLAHLSA
jgi:hypothetical protein